MNVVPGLTNANSAMSPPIDATGAWLFRIAWFFVACAGAGLVFVLYPIWMSQPDLADRFLIPLASAWLVVRAWPRVQATPHQPSAFGTIPLILGAAAFAIGWYAAVSVGGRTIVVWWLTAAFIQLTLGLAWTHLGWRHVVILAFPLLFIFFSLPTPGRIYEPLKKGLQPFTTRAAEVLLPWFGIAVQRPDPTGFTLYMPSGLALGVVEECSGLRSVTALTAIAVLVAYIRGFSFLRGLWLVGLSIGAVALSNAARVIMTGILQEYAGQEFIRGWYHEILGVGVILLGLAMIIGISALIAPRQRAVPGPESPSAKSISPALGTACASVLILGIAGGACVWVEQFRVDHRSFVRIEEISQTIGEWTSKDLKIEAMHKKELMCDQLIHREYNDSFGRQIKIWVMFWGNAATTAHMHHPDICFPSAGWEVTAPPNRDVIPLPGSTHGLPVSIRHYSKPQTQWILFFWTQEGKHVMPEGIEAPELFSGHSWIFRLLHGRKPIDQGARISVLMGTSVRGSIDEGQRLMHDFAKQFAAELYRICPQMLPQTSSAESDH